MNNICRIIEQELFPVLLNIVNRLNLTLDGEGGKGGGNPGSNGGGVTTGGEKREGGRWDTHGSGSREK